MKLVIMLITFITLLVSISSELTIEVHTDHTHNESHAKDISSHSHNHSDSEHKSEKEDHSHGSHYHFHCSNVCLALVYNSNVDINQISYAASTVVFHFPTLAPQDYISSLYRPPIA
jgi:hypothetical protein